MLTCYALQAYVMCGAHHAHGVGNIRGLHPACHGDDAAEPVRVSVVVGSTMITDKAAFNRLYNET